jgi:hypothetical protein
MAPMENILDLTRAVLATTPVRWENMAQTLPLELLIRPPATGQWCALECLQHLLDTDHVYTARLNYLLAGQDFPDFNPDQAGTPLGAAPEPLEMAARFTRLRRDSLAALAEITQADLKQRARHSALGLVSLDEMVHVWAAHDLLHTVQAERALMQPFILGSGAWQVNYQDQLMT